MKLAAFAVVRLVTLLLYVGKATSTCNKCTACGPCASPCGPNEVASPPGVRQQDNFCKPKVTSPSELNKLKVCICKPGYLRNAWGICIRKEDCSLCRRKANMDYHPCLRSCPKTCGVLEQKDCSILCRRGCACAPGYIRVSPGGPCVAPNQCPVGPPAPPPQCPGPHQVYSACPSPCPITCANLNRPPTRCPAICGDRHCVCAPGYLAVQLDPLECVPSHECPGSEPRCRGHHQRYTTCKSRCQATCAFNTTRICPAACAGEGCVCRPGYVILRENPLTCVRRQECPAPQNRCPGRGQEFTTCKSRCPRTCWESEPRKCPAVCAGEGCVCREGFVQLQDNPLVCVRRDECQAPPAQCFGANQVYTSCISPCPATCSDFGVRRFCGNKCAGKGCVCKKGFVVLKKAPLTCVRSDKCSPALEKCVGENQVYSNCKSRCPDTCEELGPRACTKECAGVGCVCKPGYVQLYEKPLLCVPRERCPRKPELCLGANEVYTSCKPSCPETCEDDGLGARVCTANCAGQGCVCKKGYVQLHANASDPLVCVLREQCPHKPKRCVGANQVYTTCKSHCPKRCSDSGPNGCTLECAGEGCVCKEGYVELQGNPLVCVLREQCPPKPAICGGANQEYTKCKSRCPQTCLDSGPKACTLECTGDGCVCKEGYVQLQDNPLICVRPEQCPGRPPISESCPGINQVYTKCKNPCPLNCWDIKVRACPPTCAGEGCECKRGTLILRKDPLTCVESQQCINIVEAVNPDLPTRNKSAVPGTVPSPEIPTISLHPPVLTNNTSMGPSIPASQPELPKNEPPPSLPPLPALPTPKPSPVPAIPQPPTPTLKPASSSAPTKPDLPANVPAPTNKLVPGVPGNPVEPAEGASSQPVTVPSVSAYPSTTSVAAHPAYQTGFPVQNAVPGSTLFPEAAMLPGNIGFPPLLVPTAPEAGPAEEAPVKTLIK